MAREIQMIETKRLRPHPQNPRRELGDLQELIASIRESGVLQNLVVVKDPDEEGCWRVVIGHRRRAAAIVAGVKEVPCVVSDMGPEEQLGAMMAENVQRSNLTLADTVMGVRSLLDLPGVDEKKAAELTGLSKAYIRDRAKIAKAVKQADVVKMEKAQATLLDMLNLARLPEENQVRVINESGESDKTIGDLIRKEVEKLDLAGWTALIEQWAVKHDVPIGSNIPDGQDEPGEYWQYWSYTPLGPKVEESLDKMLAEADGAPCYIYHRNGSNIMQLYIKKKTEREQEQVPDWKIRARLRDQAKAKYNEAKARMLKRWNEYVLRDMWAATSNVRLMEFEKYVLMLADDMALEPIDAEIMGSDAARIVWEFIGKAGEPQAEDAEIWKHAWNHMPLYGRTAILYARLISTVQCDWMMWEGYYWDESDSNIARKAMQLLGYRETDEDREIMDGTSDIYMIRDKQPEAEE